MNVRRQQAATLKMGLKVLPSWAIYPLVVKRGAAEDLLETSDITLMVGPNGMPPRIVVMTL